MELATSAAKPSVKAANRENVNINEKYAAFPERVVGLATKRLIRKTAILKAIRGPNVNEKIKGDRKISINFC